jgi:hypothetical protein
MKQINQENLLDWYNTRGGRVIIKPTFGDKLTSRDILFPPAEKKKVKRKIKSETFVESLKRRGFQKTYITKVQGGKQKVIVHPKLLDLSVIKARCRGFVSVYYGDLAENNFSKVYK